VNSAGVSSLEPKPKLGAKQKQACLRRKGDIPEDRDAEGVLSPCATATSRESYI
jgi:hypothetical protein